MTDTLTSQKAGEVIELFSPLKKRQNKQQTFYYYHQFHERSFGLSQRLTSPQMSSYSMSKRKPTSPQVSDVSAKGIFYPEFWETSRNKTAKLPKCINRRFIRLSYVGGNERLARGSKVEKGAGRLCYWWKMSLQFQSKSCKYLYHYQLSVFIRKCSIATILFLTKKQLIH